MTSSISHLLSISWSLHSALYVCLCCVVASFVALVSDHSHVTPKLIRIIEYHWHNDEKFDFRAHTKCPNITALHPHVESCRFCKYLQNFTSQMFFTQF